MSIPSEFFSTERDEILRSSSVAVGPDVWTFGGSTSEFDIVDLRKRYSGILIQLDKLRSELLRADSSYRSNDTEWSIKEIVGHMIDTDREIWWPRIEAMIEQDEPYFDNIDQQKLIVKNNWQELPLEDILSQFMRIRWSNATRLNALTEVEFQRRAQHYSLGELTVGGVVQVLVAHDAHYLSKLRGRLGMDQ